MSKVAKFKQRLINGEKILINGGMGTELQRRGVKTKLPLWSAVALIENPSLVQEIHQDYIKAGAELIVTNTFRTNRRTLEKVNQGDRAFELTNLAVELAKEAVESTNPEVLIAGDVTTLEDCYSPDLVPDQYELEKEHHEWAEFLAKAGVDIILIETINTIREVEAAIKAAKDTGLEFTVSFVCGEDGNLLSGESLEEAVEVVSTNEPIAIMTNCKPPEVIDASVQKLLGCSEFAVGVYANGDGAPADELGWEFKESENVKKFMEYSEKWLKEGVQIIGGCCGTTPEYVEVLKPACRQAGEFRMTTFCK